MTYDTTNIFAKILRGEIPSKKIFEDDFAFAFHDIAPNAPVHVLVIPKGDFVSFDDFIGTASPELQRGYFAAIRSITRQLGVQDAYRLITNNGGKAGQSVFHFHMHILAGKPLGGLLPE